MAAIVESLPRAGRLEVDIKVSADLNISAYAARQKVNAFVLSDISYLMHAGEPVLVVADKIRWHIPIVLTLTSRGDIGEVGGLDVDAQTGQLHVTPQIIAEINARAEGLARSSTSAPTE
jgi:hypothetical protein